MKTESRGLLTATVSGSFHRHMDAIARAVYELSALTVRVLSPADPRVVDAHGEFLFVASDRVRSVRLVQDRHLESIRTADFLWLVCPDGYVGQSGSMEIGFAAGAGVPIFATRAPLDLTLREYVTVVPSLSEAVTRATVEPRRSRSEGLLINPHASIEEAHDALERIKNILTHANVSSDSATDLYHASADLHATLRLPMILH